MAPQSCSSQIGKARTDLETKGWICTRVSWLYLMEKPSLPRNREKVPKSLPTDTHCSLSPSQPSPTLGPWLFSWIWACTIFFQALRCLPRKSPPTWMALPLATLSSKFQLEGLFLHGWGGSDAQSPYSGCYPLYHTTNSLLKSFRGCNHRFTQFLSFI